MKHLPFFAVACFTLAVWLPGAERIRWHGDELAYVKGSGHCQFETFCGNGVLCQQQARAGYRRVAKKRASRYAAPLPRSFT